MYAAATLGQKKRTAEVRSAHRNVALEKGIVANETQRHFAFEALPRGASVYYPCRLLN
jgi:hypothetical protein